uniref:HEAT repeat domain-containing protein n=1 Tax=uncultured marine group II/III euryarchaeote KM3_195_B08 TaxID=1457970 RepID=A0A075GUX1_9EURY|nr:hypothetical protein [uncultured marine group II/III euryarchaeote KM3_195_B08]
MNLSFKSVKSIFRKQNGFSKRAPLTDKMEADVMSKLEREDFKSLTNKDIPALISILTFARNHIRWNAVNALQRLDLEESHMDELVELLKSKHVDDRLGACMAFCHIREPKAIPGLIKLVKDYHWPIRSNARIALAELYFFTNDKRAGKVLLKSNL